MAEKTELLEEDEKVVEIELERLRGFENHPFKGRADSQMIELHDHRVPATNNEAERLLRQYKRKQQQAVTFRRFESIESLCQCMSMLIQIRQKEGTNLYGRVSQIFG